VIKEGEEGSIFYIVMSGEAVATKVMKEGDNPSEVKHYEVGDYFGERALL
jgi:cAMP-dependent protein kinase regulator